MEKDKMKKAVDFTVYNVYSSNMVFQRGKRIVFSGKADAGTSVEVDFNGVSVISCALENGVWRAEFPPMEYGGPYICKISGASRTVIFDNIMIGEVWFCSGQSNMEMPVYSESPFWRTANAEEELKNASHPELRLFNGSKYRSTSDTEELDDVKGGCWQVCSAESAADFSACAYFFGRRLAKDLGVTVGLISSAWGGSYIEPWISAEVYKDHQWTFPVSDDSVLQKQWDQHRTPELDGWARDFDRFCGKVPADTVPDDSWSPTEEKFINLQYRGRYLCFVEFELPAEFCGKSVTVEISGVNDADTTFFNAVHIGSTGLESYNCWDRARRYNVPASAVRAGVNNLLICADNHVGMGCVMLCDISVSCGKDRVFPETKVFFKEWKIVPADFPGRPAPPAVRGVLSGKDHPSTLHNGMVNPWRELAIAGVIWYQGCSNNGMTTYFETHKMLIESMRRNWKDPELPFILVQLAAFARHDPENPLSEAAADSLDMQHSSPFALVREIQSKIPQVMDNVGMVTAFDCGNHSDIHPRDKQTVGMRLAFKAEKMAYGKDVVCDGPEFDGMRIEGNRVRVYFRNAENGLTTLRGYSPMGFFIGDSDGVFYRANAVIEGSTVVLSCPEVFYPQTVRYAYIGYCRVNLTNMEGWPALPFRSDSPDYTRIFK